MRVKTSGPRLDVELWPWALGGILECLVKADDDKK